MKTDVNSAVVGEVVAPHVELSVQVDGQRAIIPPWPAVHMLPPEIAKVTECKSMEPAGR
jgi:hypothetical protein